MLTTKEKEEEDVHPYVSTYNPNNTEMFGILKYYIHIVSNDQTMREALAKSKIFKSKRQPHNLKKLLTKAKFEGQRSRTKHKVFTCLPVKFSVCVNEGQDKLPTMYWLPKLHKRPYKARFIANSSSCSTTKFSKLLTSCLTAIKSHVIKYCETVYETSNKNWFWSIKNSGEVLNKLKCRGFRATSLSTYDFFYSVYNFKT